MNGYLLAAIARLVLALCGVWVFGIVAREFWKLRRSHSIFASCFVFFACMLGGMIWLSLVDIQTLYFHQAAIRPGAAVFRTVIVLAGAWLAWSFRLRL